MAYLPTTGTRPPKKHHSRPHGPRNPPNRDIGPSESKRASGASPRGRHSPNFRKDHFDDSRKKSSAKSQFSKSGSRSHLGSSRNLPKIDGKIRTMAQPLQLVDASFALESRDSQNRAASATVHNQFLTSFAVKVAGSKRMSVLQTGTFMLDIQHDQSMMTN